MAVGDWQLAIGEAEPADRDLFLDERESLAELAGHATGKGTVVFWDRVDRLVKTKKGEDPANPRSYLSRQTSELREHLAMVFQRFLDPHDRRARTVQIWLNDELVEAWDPFCVEWVEPKVTRVFTFAGADDRQAKVILRGYILPLPNEVADERYKKSSRNRAARLQGIYLYRENRLIEGPDWMGFGALETHNNNLRIELSFPGELDEAFGVDVKSPRCTCLLSSC